MRYARIPATLMAVTLATMAGTPAVMAQGDPVTLRLAISDGVGRPSQSAVDTFVQQVATLSGGSITIDPVYDAGNDTAEGFEVGVAGLVERGDIDLGIVASRAWDMAGVSSLQALQAPFLIADDALAAAVAAGPIADDLLGGMAEAGVTGLALWPEDLRHPFSFVADMPLITPGDFAGKTILVQPSALSRSLVAALGANVFADDVDRADAVDAGLLHGAESGLLQGQSLPGTPTATGDVVFYPKFQVLVANSAALGRMTADQRSILGQAAIATRDAAIATHPSEADAAAAWCAAGGRVVLAGPDGIHAFETAAAPIFDRLEADRVTADAIAAIRDLATNVEPAAGAEPCAPTAASSPPAADLAGFAGTTLPPDGTYRSEVTQAQLIAGGATESYALQNAGVLTMILDDGTVTVEADNVDGKHRCTASASIVDERVRFQTTSPGGPGTCGITFDYLWRLDGDDLYMVVVGSADPGMTPVDLANELSWRSIPVVRIE